MTVLPRPLPSRERLALQVKVTLAPEFQAFHFGLFNPPVPIANQDFQRQLESQQPAFTWRGSKD